MRYTEKTLSEISKVAEEKGTYESVAVYLGINVSRLYEQRQNNPTLENVLKAAIEKWHVKNVSMKDYEFSKEELEDITKIVADKNIDAASAKYGLSASVFFTLRKTRPELDAAISKGQKLRTSNTLMNKALSMFNKLTYPEALDSIYEKTLNGGTRAVEEYYEVSAHILRKCRQEIPELNKAIMDALAKRPIGAAIPSTRKKLIAGKKDKAQKDSKAVKKYNKSGSRKPPRELIDTTMLGISEQSEQALANFRKSFAERKLREDIRSLRSEYDDMIGY